MSLRYRLRAPVTAALAGVLATGLLATLETAAPSFADPTTASPTAAPTGTPPASPTGTPSASATPPASPSGTPSAPPPPTVAPPQPTVSAPTPAPSAPSAPSTPSTPSSPTTPTTPTTPSAAGTERSASSLASAKAAAVKADGLTRSRAIFPRSSYLCYGYSDCSNKGYSPAGYAAANDKMYWRMYAGHNCTNYAAYRMVRSGMPNVRPWSGGGNATYWGGKNPSITNGTPTVGAVAWWRANTGPAGSAGHVAYVERIVSSTEIIVSQDSWGGDFSWAVITKASGNWPSGFVHFNDVAMVLKSGPKVSGQVKVGSTLTTTPGVWSPSDAKVTFQWFAAGAPIAGATGASYTLAPADLGKAITVRATASKTGYPKATTSSVPTVGVLPGELQPVGSPRLSGYVQVERTLSMRAPRWNVGVLTSTQWYANGVPIPGQTGATLALTPALVNRTITAVVTARRNGYTSVAVRSPGTARVAPGLIRTLSTPVVRGATQPGQVLTVTPGSYHPADAALAIQWMRNGVAIPGATGTTYQLTYRDLGSLVSARVAVSAAGYVPAVAKGYAARKVRSTPTVHVVRKVRAHGARLRIGVTAPGVRPVTGSIVVRVQGGFQRRVTLRNGRAVVDVSGLTPGTRAFRITFGGSSTVLPGRAAGAVRVR